MNDKETLERCAKIADERATLAKSISPNDLQQFNMASQIAASIRALPTPDSDADVEEAAKRICLAENVELCLDAPAFMSFTNPRCHSRSGHSPSCRFV